MRSGSPSPTTISALLCLLLVAAVACVPFVAAEAATAEELYATIASAPTTAIPGFNSEGTSVLTNFANALNEGQLFFIRRGDIVFERPESKPVVSTSALEWCSDLTFSDIKNNSLVGYAGRCVGMFLTRFFDDAVESGAQMSFAFAEENFDRTAGLSAVFVEEQNVFEGQFHANTDDWTIRYWDSGLKKGRYIMWEGHDEGDMSPNAGTSSLSAFGEMTWVSVEEVAQLFNTSVDEFTPETFKQVYSKTWIKDHEYEAAVMNPFPDAELAIIEQVKNETNYVDDTATATPVQPDNTEEDGGIVDANPVGGDPSGSGRKLASVASRFVSAALRIFGI